MNKTLTDEELWELSDMYEKGDVSKDDVIFAISLSTKSYDAALNDYLFVFGEEANNAEKKHIKELINAHNRKKSN